MNGRQLLLQSVCVLGGWGREYFVGGGDGVEEGR